MFDDWVLFIFEIIGLILGIIFSVYVLPNNTKTKLLSIAIMVFIIGSSIWVAASIRLDELSSIFVYGWVFLRYFVIAATIISILGISKES